MLSLQHRFEFEDQSVAWGTIGQGEPIVLIHGFPWSSQAWRRVAPHLADRRQVFYFDMVGCGQSEKRAGQEVSPAVQNKLLSALFDHWSLSRPDVVAHDFGGLAALRGYFLDGLRYNRLTLVDAVGVLPSGSPFYVHVRENEAAFAALPAYAHEAMFKAYIQNAAKKPLGDEAVEIYAAPWRGPNGQAAFYRQIAQSGDEYVAEVERLYAPMDCDVDLVWGAHDSFIPLSQGEQLASRLAARSFKVVADAAHIVQEDAPEAIIATLLGAPANTSQAIAS